MISDGHGIPFETFRSSVQQNVNFNVLVSPKYIDCAVEITRKHFINCKVTVEERKANKVIIVWISSKEGKRTVALCADENLTRYKKLTDATGICFDNIPFTSLDALKEFQNANIERFKSFESLNDL
jgi:hypothetical protein